MTDTDRPVFLVHPIYLMQIESGADTNALPVTFPYMDTRDGEWTRLA